MGDSFYLDAKYALKNVPQQHQCPPRFGPSVWVLNAPHRLVQSFGVVTFIYIGLYVRVMVC